MKWGQYWTLSTFKEQCVPKGCYHCNEGPSQTSNAAPIGSRILVSERFRESNGLLNGLCSRTKVPLYSLKKALERGNNSIWQAAMFEQVKQLKGCNVEFRYGNLVLHPEPLKVQIQNWYLDAFYNTHLPERQTFETNTLYHVYSRIWM